MPTNQNSAPYSVQIRRMSVDQSSQVRVRFFTQHLQFSVTDAPFSIPAKLGRQGLSEVINHLLDNTTDYQSFDFIVNDQLVRSPLYKVIAVHRINTEDIVDIEFFPALTLSEESDSTELPSWIGSIAIDDSSSKSQGVAGCYDGTIKMFDPESLSMVASVAAHEDPIRAICSWRIYNTPDKLNIASGSKDHTVKTWRYDPSSKSLIVENLLHGHLNSVESVAWWNTSSNVSGLILSGDWGGSLAAWKLSDKVQNHLDQHVNKKKKDNDGNAATMEASRVQPLFMLKAHQQSLNSLTSCSETNNVFTASWDHSIKQWDLDRQDCVHTLNCAKVVSSIDCGNAGLLASSHPDGKVRIWDYRVKSSGTSSITLGKTSDWISQVFYSILIDIILVIVISLPGSLET